MDDESRMRKLVKDFLTREGYTVLEARDGMEAMDLFTKIKRLPDHFRCNDAENGWLAGVP